MRAGYARVEGYDGHPLYRDVLPSHSAGHKVHEEVREREALWIAAKWAAEHPPHPVGYGQKPPYLMVVLRSGDRLASWVVRDGKWSRKS